MQITNLFSLKTLLAGIVCMAVFSFTIQSDSIPQRAEDISPLLTGEKVPEQMQLTTIENASFDLSKAVRTKPTILIFYRGGWCPYCNRQLAGMMEIEESLLKLGYQIIAISPDKPEELKKTLDKSNLNYTLLSDSKMRVASQFGIVFQAASKSYNQLEKSSGEKHHLLPVPAVFVLDTQGVIKFEYINPNFKERLHPKLLLTAAELAGETSK